MSQHAEDMFNEYKDKIPGWNETHPDTSAKESIESVEINKKESTESSNSFLGKWSEALKSKGGEITEKIVNDLVNSTDNNIARFLEYCKSGRLEHHIKMVGAAAGTLMMLEGYMDTAGNEPSIAAQGFAVLAIANLGVFAFEARQLQNIDEQNSHQSDHKQE